MSPGFKFFLGVLVFMATVAVAVGAAIASTCGINAFC